MEQGTTRDESRWVLWTKDKETTNLSKICHTDQHFLNETVSSSYKQFFYSAYSNKEFTPMENLD